MSRSERGARPGRPPSSSARGSCVGQGGLGVAGVEKAGGESAAMRRNGSAAVGFLAIVLACSPGNAWTADGRSPSVLTYRNERLSVRLVGVSLEEVMTNLGRAIGAQVYGTVPQPREVSVEFDDVPLVEALDRLLGAQNYVLKYGKGDRLRAIKLLGGPGVPIRTAATPAPTTPTPAPAVTASGVPKARDPGGAVAMLDDHAAIPLSGRLAQALGTDAATFRQLFDAAVHDEDAAVRSDAMHAWLGALDAEPEFRDRVLQALNTLDDFTLTEMLRGLAGSRAEEIAALIAAHVRGSDLRSRARGILLRLGDAATLATTLRG